MIGSIEVSPDQTVARASGDFLVIVKLQRVFVDDERGEMWLHAPCAELGGATPWDTWKDYGYERIVDVLDAMARGEM